MNSDIQRTECSDIPDNWSLIPLNDLSVRIGDGIHATPKYSQNTYYHFINGNNLSDGKITVDTRTLCVDQDEWQKNKRPLSDQTILISINGTIGNLAYYRGEPIVLGKSAAYINLRNSTDRRFILYALGSDRTKNFFGNQLTGTTIGNLSLKTLRATPIAVPPLPEQRAIAEALSDVDELINSLDKLIAKKRAIKQATMQQLLTGKTRLPGFSGEWSNLRLGDILKVCHGKSQQSIENPNGEHPILATGGEIGRTDSFLFDKPSVLIGRKGTIDSPQYMNLPFWTIDTLFYTKINPPQNVKYIFYLFCKIDWRSYNEASGVPSLSASTIENINVRIPDSNEQLAIVDVLETQDEEIGTLRRHRNKTQLIKQGMMQELLTGKTRLN